MNAAWRSSLTFIPKPFVSDSKICTSPRRSGGLRIRPPKRESTPRSKHSISSRAALTLPSGSARLFRGLSLRLGGSAMRADLDAIEEAINAEAAAASKAVLARRRVDLLLAQRAVSEVPAAESPVSPALRTRADLARALGISVATVDRNTRAGMPCVIVSTRRRYDLAVVREWLEGRTGRPAAAGGDPPDTIDVRNVARLAGLRVVGEGRP